VKPRLHNALAAVAGFVAANVVMFSAQLVNERLYPELMAAVAAGDPARLAAEAAKPGTSGALVVVLVAWLAGSAVGGFLATRLAAGGSRLPALVLGALLTLGGVFNNLAFPPPIWFWIATPLALLLPALLAASLVPRSPSPA